MNEPFLNIKVGRREQLPSSRGELRRITLRTAEALAEMARNQGLPAASMAGLDLSLREGLRPSSRFE